MDYVSLFLIEPLYLPTIGDAKLVFEAEHHAVVRQGTFSFLVMPNATEIIVPAHCVGHEGICTIF